MIEYAGEGRSRHPRKDKGLALAGFAGHIGVSEGAAGKSLSKENQFILDCYHGMTVETKLILRKIMQALS